MSSVPERSDIDLEYRWNVASIYADSDEWETAVSDVRTDIERLDAYTVTDVTDAETLLTVLELRDAVMREVSTIVTYARMRSDEDTRNQEFQALQARAQSLYSDAASAASFIEPAIQQFDREELPRLIDTAPDLETYQHYIDDVLRMKPHTRSSEIEELLADLSEVTGAAGEVYRTLTNADMDFPSVEDPDGEKTEITLSNFTTLQKHPDREYRRRVFETFYDTWAEFDNTVATAYEKSIRRDNTIAETRNYETARQAALDDANVPVDVYDTLIDTVRNNTDVLDRHARLKRDRRNLDTLCGWDLYVPATTGESPTVEYGQAADHVVDALGCLGEDYQSRVNEGLDSRWVDVYENRGKRSGAYSSGTYDTQPFILMNYQDDISSMYTLAHELGHSLHSQLASEHQPYIYSDYEIFVAEVASTVNEVLLTHHLLETVEDDRFRRHVLNEYLERFRSTLFRQTMFAEFELRAHEIIDEGGALTPDRLNELYGELKETYYPSASLDDRIAREWMRIPHFYRAFYVYQYATGISAAVDIATRILDGDDSTREDYLEALRLGGSEYPVDILDTAGVDVTSDQYINAAITEYEQATDRLAGL